MINDIECEKTKAFAKTAYEYYFIDELMDTNNPDKTDMKQWNIDAEQWRHAIKCALADLQEDEKREEEREGCIIVDDLSDWMCHSPFFSKEQGFEDFAKEIHSGLDKRHNCWSHELEEFEDFKKELSQVYADRIKAGEKVPAHVMQHVLDFFGYN